MPRMYRSGDRLYDRSLFSGDVLETLRLDIVSGRIPAGTRLVEAQLAATMGTSRGPIRTALLHLEKEGLVRLRPSGGVEVVGFSPERAEELFDTRLCLESFALRLAIRKGAAGVERLFALVDDMRKEGKASAESAHTDIQFHRCLVDMADNWALLQAWSTLSPVILSVLTVTNSVEHDFDLIVALHQRLSQAIAAGREAEALSILEEHITVAKKTLRLRLGTLPVE